MVFRFNRDKMSFPNGQDVTLPLPVLDMLEDKDRCYVVLDVPRGVLMNDNVLCFDSQGTIRWRIQNKLTGPDTTKYEGVELYNNRRSCPFCETRAASFFAMW